MTEIGKKVPNFKGQTNNGIWNLSDHLGKKVIVYFYPKDNTPGCTTETKEFNAAIDKLAKNNTVIVGISNDNLISHKKFIDKLNIKFPLIADEEKIISELFSVYQLKKFMGKEFMGIVRSTFLIDENGVLQNEWRKIRVKGHVDNVISYIK